MDTEHQRQVININISFISISIKKKRCIYCFMIVSVFANVGFVAAYVRDEIKSFGDWSVFSGISCNDY